MKPEVETKAWPTVLVTTAVAASAAYAWRTRLPTAQVDKWLLVPALIATIAAFVGSQRRTAADRVAWLAITGSCAMTMASFTIGFYRGSLDPATLDGLAGILRAPDRTLIALGLIAMIAARSPIRDRYVTIEATIVALAASLVMWVFIVEPAIGRSQLEDADLLLSLALPASDLVLVALAVRLWLGYRARNRAFSLLLIGLVARLGGNLLSYWGKLTSGDTASGAMVVLTTLSLMLFAAAAIDRTGLEQPQVAHRAVQLDPLRLGTIAISALTPQLILLSLVLNGNSSRSTLGVTAVVAALVTGLSLARLWGLAVSVRDLTERRGKDRLASLVERSSDVVVLVDTRGQITYTSGAMNTVLGYDPDHWLRWSIHDLPVAPSGESWWTTIERIRSLEPDATTNVEAVVRHANGTEKMMDLTAVNLIANVAVAGVVLTFRDITATRKLQSQLSFRADHDELTGLANRAQFLTRLNDTLHTHQLPVVMFLDLDDFKVVNDTMGHESGDVLLRSVADRLCKRIGDGPNLVARLGGDEFAVLLIGTDAHQASILATQAVNDLRDPIVLSAFHTVAASCSIGIAQSEPGDTASAVLRNADFAMYRAKRRGKGYIEIFDAELEHEVARTEEYRRDLVSALGNDQFVLEYQPIIRLHDGILVGAEALIRWHHHVYGAVKPADFIEIAEQTGVIIPIGWWSIRQACVTAAGWDDDSLFVTVNVSGSQLRGAGLVDHVRAALTDSGLAPHRLVLEITESMLIDDPDGAAEELIGVRELGVRVALDDFGTGYSSLAYVQRLPLDMIKIDREFVQELGGERDQALTRTIVAMAHNLGLQTIGEGVEAEQQAVELAAMGCDFSQGYLFSLPLSATAMRVLIDQLKPAPVIEVPHVELHVDVVHLDGQVPMIDHDAAGDRDAVLAKLLRPLMADPAKSTTPH